MGNDGEPKLPVPYRAPPWPWPEPETADFVELPATLAKRRVPWLSLVAPACVAFAVYGLFFRPTQQPSRNPPSYAPGWLEIASCFAMGSLDASKELIFKEDQTVEFREDGEIRPAAGRWSFDEASKRYSIMLGEQLESFSLLSLGDPPTCILFKGTMDSADLRTAWFSTPAPPDEAPIDFDYAPPRPS
jgi:hypothetical protein